MKRNSKGFTLIELLGAIVILGILIGVSVPIIVSLLDTSRNKMYINDAKKLVTQAEYKLKSNSSDIEKPDEGDCILVSMVYLDSSDFDNPPNEGKYEKESSYVVIKNNNGKLEYSVTIVEKVKKGGYKGVELVRDSVLFSNDAISHVVSFKETEVINVETDVNKGYINEKLGNDYISTDNSIAAVYNYPDLSDSSSNADVGSTPRITFASLISTSSRGYNSLDATLQLKVDDKDTARNKLNVYLSVDSGYEAATTAIPYGDNDTFSYNINFADYGKVYDGSSLKLYIVVSDPEGNSTKKTMTYKIHNNVAPEIDDTTSITKRVGDGANMTIASVNMEVSDDIDSLDLLKVCLKDSNTNQDFDSCEVYKNYYEYFNENNKMEYQFTSCNGTCKRDGSKHYLTIFVKDSLGGISKKKLSYTFSTNTAPTIKSLSVDSLVESFTSTGSKTIVINVNAIDDIDNRDNLSIIVSGGAQNKTYRYSEQPIYYDAGGNYDGSHRTISVSVADREGGVTTETRDYTLYNNKKPVINSFDVVSDGAACSNTNACPLSEGGKKNVNVYLDATDDIDYEGLSVCLSLNPNSCDNYISYTNFAGKYYSYEVAGDYDGSTKTIYATVKDSLGLTEKTSIQYKLYKQKAPIIDYFIVASKTDGVPSDDSLNATFTIAARDDFDSAENLRLQIIEDGVVKINNAVLSNYLNKNNNYTFSGDYDGKKRELEVKITDTNSSVASATVEYQVYKDKGPTIDSFNVYSSQAPCINATYCDENGNVNANYSVIIHDDLDTKENLQVCVSDNESCSDYSSYSNYYDGSGNPVEKSYTVNVSDPTRPYDGSVKNVNLFVKDSKGNITTKEYKYILYKNKAPIVIGNASIEPYPDDVSENITDATYSVIVEDDLDTNLQIKYCYKLDDNVEHCTSNYETYNENKVLDNSFFNSSSPNGEEYKVYAKIKDSYGSEVVTEPVSYELYVDRNPEVNYLDIINGTPIYKNASGNIITSLDEVDDPENYSLYTKFKIAFSIDDPYDTYSICLSENGTTCSNYTGTYTGNICRKKEVDGVEITACEKEINVYNVYYEKSGDVEEDNPIELYLFVKDSYNHKISKKIYDKNYEKCSEYDLENANYTYEFNEEQTINEIGDNQPISIDKCSGKCYQYNSYKNETNAIYAYYNMKIKYTDKFKSTEFCQNPDDPDDEYTERSIYKASCDFKNCFYKSNNYNRYAIGTHLYDDDENWTLTINDNTYTCTGYYNLYLSSYVEGQQNITLTKTNTKICKEAFDDHIYDYNSTSSNPYVIIDD